MPSTATALSQPEFHIHRYPAALIDRVDLKDGRRAILRPVLPQDAQAEQAFVTAMTPQTRHRRFHVPIRELGPRLLQALTQIDYRSHVAIVAHAAPHRGLFEEPAIVADARYALLDGNPHEAEFAIAVADEWQGVGLGTAMMRFLLDHARSCGVRRLAGDVLHDNERMLATVRRLGARLRRHPDDPLLVLAELSD